MTNDAFGTDHIAYLQRISDREIVLSGEQRAGVPHELRRLSRVHGIGRVEKLTPDPNRDVRVVMPSRDVLTGLYGHKLPLSFVVRGTAHGASVGLGTWSNAGGEQVSQDTLDARQDVVRRHCAGSIRRSISPTTSWT